MSEPTFALQIEFVSGSWTNIGSGDILRASWERSLADLFTPLRADQALFELANLNGTYSPKKNANMVPGKRIRLKGTHRVQYLSLPGTSGNYASTPDSPAVSITGDIDIRLKVALDDWTPADINLLIGQELEPSRAFWLQVNTSGVLSLSWTPTGLGANLITKASTAAVGASDGAAKWVRATLDVDNGAGGYDVKFYTSDDGETWTQLGSTVTTAGSTSIFDSTTTLKIGARGSGTISPLAGKVYYAEVRNGIDGDVVAKFDPEDAVNASATAWMSQDTGEVWTINQSGGSPAALAIEDGTEYGLYSGRIREVKQAPGFGQKTALIEALSEVDRLNRTKLTTPLFTNINAGSLFTEIMTRCAVASFSCEALADTVPFAWYQDRPADEALYELVQSGNYKVFIDGNGTVQVKGRYFGAFDDSQASLTEWHDLQYALSPDSVVNEVKINGQPRTVSSLSTLASIPAPISLPASSSLGVWLAYIDPLEPSQITPAQSVVTPVSSTDFYIATSSDGTGTNLTSGVSLSFTAFGSTAVATLTNGNGVPGWITRLQVRGHPALRAGQIGIRTEDSSSQAVYGKQAIDLQNILVQNYSYLDDLATYLIGERKNPRDDVTHALKNEWPEQLAREPGEVISMVESTTGINSQWSVRSVDHELSLAAGLEHVSTYKVEVFSDRPWLVLDHPSFGKLDSGRVLAL